MRRAHGSRRARDEFCDGGGGDETAAADDHTWQLTRAKQLVNRVPGDAAEEPTGLLNRIEFGLVHGCQQPE